MDRLELKMPAVALRGKTILPEMITHFDVSRSRSVKAVERALAQEQKLFVVAQRDPDQEDPGMDDVFTVGTVVQIKQIVKMPHGILRVLSEGLYRAELEELERGDCLEAYVMQAAWEGFGDLPEVGREAMFRNLKEIYQKYCESSGKVSKELSRQVLDSPDLERLMVQILVHTPLDWRQQQRLLETEHFAETYETLGIMLNNEVEIEQYRKSIREKVKARVDKQQKEYLLREQMKVIREELGEDASAVEPEKLRERAKELEASDEVKERIEKEIQRLSLAGANSAEASVIRSYIETLLELPWEKKSAGSLDLKSAEEILEREHYGLEKVKERVIEFLAVRQMADDGESPILCLVGPPGTGKTSIARSIAHAMNREYVRICLGGVHDEAEIRGHRKTYIGAMPGRVAEGIRQAGVKNPVMVLDEIDKVGTDYRGDACSALLEALDSEQNGKFRDHYVELPIDLSEVVFICTANDAQKIPRPLLDRMEIIEIGGYTANEKLHIAEEHLLPKQRKRHGLDAERLSISTGAMERIIRQYTREAGVRALERTLAGICRKADREILESGCGQVCVTEQNLETYMGKPKYDSLERNEKDEIGIVRGLAWTSVGGDTLEIEVNLMPGKGNFELTGQLGDVMQESAKTGISYIRSISDEYALDRDYFQEHDIHIHIPEGAVPKDGPSAGITMTTAMLSAILEKPVRADVAMTGEITLRGRVLPIGGLKEKLLAARSAGMRTVIVPEKKPPGRGRTVGRDHGRHGAGLCGNDGRGAGARIFRRDGRMIIKQAELETVCGITSKLPENTLPEVAFAGKSNVGKSSLINALLNRKALARTSSQPGKTQTINFYKINQAFYLVDLPGYGYAKASVEIREKWGKMIERYLHGSRQLRAVFLLIDIRHEPSANDRDMYQWIVYQGYKPVIIATKLDKIKRSQLSKQIKLIKEGLGLLPDARIVPFSAETKQGRDEIWEIMEEFAKENAV